MCCLETKKIKCVVWDLDNTIWEGTLAEKDNVKPREGVYEIIKTLDNRGILQSVASKNEEKGALEKLKKFGLEEFFLYPQINWSAKSESIKKIASSLNIGINSIAFIDDQPYEREEVSFHLSDVFCIDANNLNNILSLPGLNPEYLTTDSKLRRQMYINDIERNESENVFKGTGNEFLKSLEMVLDVFNAGKEDLLRALELTERTNQLNSTGITYSLDELSQLSQSQNHILIMARLKDKFGTYGHIGLVLIEKKTSRWEILLFLMSCRVMSRGIGTALLSLIINATRINKVSLFAYLKPTDRNRIMKITYRFAGFEKYSVENGVELLKYGLYNKVDNPDYIYINTEKLNL